MNLKKIISITGNNGLFKLIKSTRNGLLLEKIDDTKQKLYKNSGFSKVISLENVFIYTQIEGETVPVATIIYNIYQKYKKNVPITNTDENEKIHEYMRSVLPSYDNTRVHPSQILKIFNWYNILFQYLPEIFEEVNTQKEGEEESKEEMNNDTTKLS